VVSKQRWARALRVHGCGSVHAMVELRKDVRDLHHLTGHYRAPLVDCRGIPTRIEGQLARA